MARPYQCGVPFMVIQHRQSSAYVFATFDATTDLSIHILGLILRGIKARFVGWFVAFSLFVFMHTSLHMPHSLFWFSPISFFRNIHSLHFKLNGYCTPEFLRSKQQAQHTSAQPPAVATPILA